MSAWQDCGTAGMAGKSIPGNIPAIEAMGLRWVDLAHKASSLQGCYMPM